MNLTLTNTSKIVGITVGVLTILSVLCGFGWSYNKNYVDGKMGKIEQKLDDVIGRLDRSGIK